MSRWFLDSRLRAPNDGNRAGWSYQCNRAASGSGIRGGGIRGRGIDRTDGNRSCRPSIAFCLCLVKDAAVEQQVALIGSHLLLASRPDLLGNPVSSKLPPRICLIATALLLGSAVAPCGFGAAARCIVAGHLRQCRQGNERGSDHEKRSDHRDNSLMGYDCSAWQLSQ